MNKNNGFEFTPQEGGIGMPEQNECPYVPFSTGSKMRRSKGQARVFDNNGGNSKAGNAGTVNNNDAYGPVTYGF